MPLPPARRLVATALVLALGGYGCSAASAAPPELLSTSTGKLPTRAGDPASATGSPDQVALSAPAGPGVGGEANGATGPLSAEYVDYAINHVLSTGQSNSVGNGGAPALTTQQPYSNLMFDTGVMAMSNCDGDGCYGFDAPTSFLPLVEGDRYFDYAVETASSSLANEISRLAKDSYRFGAHDGYPAKHDVLVSLHGRSGNTYWCLRKGGCAYHPDSMVKPFSQAMMEVQAAKQIADAAGLSYAVRAVTVVHGESDHYSYGAGRQEFPLDGSDGSPGKIADYGDALLEWQHDYETDSMAITGQKVGVPMLISQLSGWNDLPTSKLAQMQLDAHLRAPGKVVLVTPGYALSVREDCLHYDSAGERRLGEYFAKAYAKIVFSHEAWEPVRPVSVTRNGNVVTVKFLVPKAPLVLDTQRVTDPGDYGFEVLDNGGATAITNVAVTAPDTVTITLASAPSGNGTRLRYAQNQPVGSCIGPGTTYPGGARGNLRDSDDAPSESGNELFNWSVAFDVAVN